MTRFTVRTILAPSGERLPVLVDRSVGMPAFYPNLYVLTELRQTNRASATIERALREIAVLLDFLADVGVDLADRIRKGRLLTLGEIDGLARHCRQSVKSSKEAESTSMAHVHRLGKVRASSPTTVSHTTTANRLRTIHAYLSWLIALRLSHAEQREIDSASLGRVKARIPTTKGRSTLGLRQGLPPEVLERLLQIVDPTSPENPWRSTFARQRNALIICWLTQLGLRRGELLNVKISDIDFRGNEVLIVRRADAPDDPRRAQPKVKTRVRKLPLSAELAELSHRYIMQDRFKIPGARRHGYLFVATHTGAPMAMTTLNKVFKVLRLKIPDIPDDLSAHMLRHTWNDEFSRVLAGRMVPAEKEEQMRNYLMGWAPTSTTARQYTRRYVEEAARKASLDVQGKMIEKNDK